MDALLATVSPRSSLCDTCRRYEGCSKSSLTHTASESRGSSAAQPRCPVFYLNYDPEPFASPWRDMIGSVVKLWRGSEYTIRRPRDILTAWAQVMFKISNTKSQPVVSRSEAINGLMGK